MLAREGSAVLNAKGSKDPLGSCEFVSYDDICRVKIKWGTRSPKGKRGNRRETRKIPKSRIHLHGNCHIPLPPLSLSFLDMSVILTVMNVRKHRTCNSRIRTFLKRNFRKARCRRTVFCASLMITLASLRAGDGISCHAFFISLQEMSIAGNRRRVSRQTYKTRLLLMK